MSSIPFQDNPEYVAFRLKEHEDKLRELANWRRDVDTSRAAEKVTIDNMAEAMEKLTITVDGLRKVLIGFALSIAGSAVVFALTILAATGKI